MTRSVLVGCEYSGTVRDAFLERGWDAWSCDLLESESKPWRHLRCDISRAIEIRRWDLIILHIPCTAMALCGNKHYGLGKPKHAERVSSIIWTLGVVNYARAHADAVALENPASVIFPILRKGGADVQYIHPWQHGHPEQKTTGLALWNLPRIVETNNVHGEMMQLPVKERERIFHMPPSADRGKERARFYQGFADAMADQWGSYLSGESSCPSPDLFTARRAA